MSRRYQLEILVALLFNIIDDLSEWIDEIEGN